MQQKDIDFEDGRSYGKWEFSQKLLDFSKETGNDEFKEFIIKFLEKNEEK